MRKAGIFKTWIEKSACAETLTGLWSVDWTVAYGLDCGLWTVDY